MVSVGGRRGLIKITSQPVYLMTVMKPPKKFIKEIDKLGRHFLWAGDSDLTGPKCKVAWPRVCQSTVNGGLGIKDLVLFSRSLRLRWMWFSWDSRERPWNNYLLTVKTKRFSTQQLELTWATAAKHPSGIRNGFKGMCHPCFSQPYINTTRGRTDRF